MCSLDRAASAVIETRLRKLSAHVLSLSRRVAGGTTAALTFATKTYVKTIRAAPGGSSFTVTTPTFFGGELEAEIDWKDVQPLDSYHPFATFEVSGRLYYLDEAGEPAHEFKEALQAALGRKSSDDEGPSD